MLELIHIGHSAKTRGINGAFKTRIDNHYIPSLLKARAVFINLNGSKVPFLIESAEEKGHILLKLDEIDSPEAASALLSKELYLDKTEVDESVINQQEQVHELVGYSLYNQGNELISTIDEIVEYPNQILAKLKYNGSEVLIPVHEDLIIELQPEHQRIQLEIAEGLLSLN